MTAFKFVETVPAPTMLTTALGTGSGNTWTDSDIGKAVKLSTAHDSTCALATQGDEIFGFVKAVGVGTVNNGYSHGSIQVEGWVSAKVGANQGSTPMAVGDHVVADTQAAMGTSALPSVKTSSTSRMGWKVARIVSGAGAAGSEVLLFRC